ncbi:hypothetical protein PENTCL1PPCAC_7355, partial [Pristionchus entomophagus]
MNNESMLTEEQGIIRDLAGASLAPRFIEWLRTGQLYRVQHRNNILPLIPFVGNPIRDGVDFLIQSLPVLPTDLNLNDSMRLNDTQVSDDGEESNIDSSITLQVTLDSARSHQAERDRHMRGRRSTNDEQSDEGMPGTSRSTQAQFSAEYVQELAQRQAQMDELRSLYPARFERTDPSSIRPLPIDSFIPRARCEYQFHQDA